jgi:hypothetical protein
MVLSVASKESGGVNEEASDKMTAAKEIDGNEDDLVKTASAKLTLRQSDNSWESGNQSLRASDSIASCSSAYDLARKPFFGFSSTTTTSFVRNAPTLHRIQRYAPSVTFGEPNLDDVEVGFLRTVSLTGIPIAKSEEIQLDCVDRRLDTQARHGAVMQIHRGMWRGQKAAFKYIRRGWFPDESERNDRSRERAYRQDLHDLSFELQILSKRSLRMHPNITQLLAVCFDTASHSSQSLDAFAEPGLILELAYEKYPDLGSIFDVRNSQEHSSRLHYNTCASFIADVADGIQVLHDHDLVHADLKPGNILLFPNSSSRCGITAKITDFGFAGMVNYTQSGVRAPLPEGRPRGGTPEWNAPECLQNGDPFLPYTSRSLDFPQYKPLRDIYSFGLLTAYIALDGRSPKHYVQNLADVKLSGRMLDAVVLEIERHWPTELTFDRSIKSSAIMVARKTLALAPTERVQSLRSLEVRRMLFDDL